MPAPVRPLLAVVALTAALGLLAVWVTQTAFASRYLSVIVAFVLVLAGRGVAQLADVRVRSLVLTGLVGLGAMGSWALRASGAVDRLGRPSTRRWSSPWR